LKWLALAALVACVKGQSVIDMHVDLAHAAYTGARFDDPAGEVTRDKLARGRVQWLVLPLFVESAYRKPPSRVRDEYEATWRALTALEVPTRTTLAFEGADGFADDARGIDRWFARGVCVVGLVHDRDNALAGSSTDPAPPQPGRSLTAAGRALAERVIDDGGILDVAHASDASAAELIQIAKGRGAIAIDSHTGMRTLAQSRRNLSDEAAHALAETDGVVAISMHSGHVGRTPGEPATLDDVASHIEYAVSILGASHVAIGSDFDGLIVPPIGSDGEATWPALVATLERRGMKPTVLRAVLHDNAARVLGRCR